MYRLKCRVLTIFFFCILGSRTWPSDVLQQRPGHTCLDPKDYGSTLPSRGSDFTCFQKAETKGSYYTLTGVGRVRRKHLDHQHHLAPRILERLPSSRPNQQRCRRLAQCPEQTRPREESAATLYADHVVARGEPTYISADQIGLQQKALSYPAKDVPTAAIKDLQPVGPLRER